MPAKSSAAKRYRQSEKRRIRNRAARSRINSEKRKFLEAVSEEDSIAAESAYQSLSRLIDSASNKGLYPRNTADRKKSRLHKRLNELKAE